MLAAIAKRTTSTQALRNKGRGTPLVQTGRDYTLPVDKL